MLNYEFGLVGSSPVSDLTIATPGNNLDVEVYLRETGDPGNTLSTERLFSAAVRLTFSSAAAAVQDAGQIFANPAFDIVSSSVSATGATLNVAAFFNPLVAPDANNRILLGTFRITGLSDGVAVLTAVDLSPSAETITGNGTVLDSSIAPGSATLTVGSGQEVIIPEPSSILLLGIGAPVLLFLRRRARPKNAAFLDN